MFSWGFTTSPVSLVVFHKNVQGSKRRTQPLDRGGNKISVNKGCGDSLELQDGFSRGAEAGLVLQHLWVQLLCRGSCGTARPEASTVGEKAAMLR